MNNSGADQIIWYLVLRLQNTIYMKFVRVSGVLSHLQSHLIVTLKPPHTPPPPPPLHSRAAYCLPACSVHTYTIVDTRYKDTYTSATSQTGCSHDFLVPNNDARWPELPDYVALIYFINYDSFLNSRLTASKFYAFLVFSFTN